MYAVKCVNLCNDPETVYYYKARDYADACEIRRRFILACEGYWEQDQDYTSDVVQVDDDFDFENQNREGWDLQ